MASGRLPFLASAFGSSFDLDEVQRQASRRSLPLLRETSVFGLFNLRKD